MDIALTEEERQHILERRERKAKAEAYARAIREAAQLAYQNTIDGMSAREIAAGINALQNPWSDA